MNNNAATILSFLSTDEYPESHARNWHHPDDAPIRRNILFRLLVILKCSSGTIDQQKSDLAKQVELRLYHLANSLEEYQQPKTLKRRFEAYMRKKEADRAMLNFSTDYSIGLFRQQFKRSALEVAPPLRAKTRRVNTFDYHSDFMNLMGEIQSQILSYLDTNDVVQMCSLNRGSYTAISPCVKSISVSRKYLSNTTLASSTKFLVRWSHVEKVRFSIEEVSQSSLPTSTVDTCIAVRNLMMSLSVARPQKLRELCFDSSYCDSTNDRITKIICHGLMEQSCPFLESLSLKGNSISDDGAEGIAKLIESDACKELRTLNLYDNYIGERGGGALLKMVRAKSTKLEEVKLCNNLLSVASLERIARAHQIQ